jgi:hypothetical protein
LVDCELERVDVQNEEKKNYVQSVKSERLFYFILESNRKLIKSRIRKFLILKTSDHQLAAMSSEQPMRDRFSGYVKSLQSQIVESLEKLDPNAGNFKRDSWVGVIVIMKVYLLAYDD